MKMSLSHDRGMIRKPLDKNFILLLALLAALLIFAGIWIPGKFFSPVTFKSIAFQIPEIAMLSCGMMLCMISGGIDLSTVGLANLCAVVCAKLLVSGIGNRTMFAAAILAALIIGVIAGAFNGLLIGFFHIPAMLITLSTLQVFTGLALVITKGPAITGISESFQLIANGTVFGIIPYSLIIMFVCVAALAYILKCTAYGKRLYMMGTNSVASAYSGINNGMMNVVTYALSGLLAAIAGILICSHYGSAKSDYGTTYTLQTLLIVILGGTAPDGGEGKPLGAILAVLDLQVISNILSVLRVNSFVKTAVFGGILLAVILVKQTLKQRTKTTVTHQPHNPVVTEEKKRKQ